MWFALDEISGGGSQSPHFVTKTDWFAVNVLLRAMFLIVYNHHLVDVKVAVRCF